MEVYYI